MAMPPVDIDQKQLKALMRLNPTLADAAAFFECETRTILRYIQKHFEMSFSEFRERHMVHTRLDLVRNALKAAHSGNTVMMIFCLKNLCGWQDKKAEEIDLNLKSKDKETILAEFRKTVNDPGNGRK